MGGKAAADSWFARQRACTARPPTRLPFPVHRRGQSSPYQPAISPEPVAHLAQHRLLPLLVDAALKEPAIDLRMGHRWACCCCWGRWGCWGLACLLRRC